MFLNPAEEARAQATQRMIDRVLLPMRNKTVIAQPGMGRCAKDLMFQIAEFGDEAMLTPVMIDQTRIYKRFYEESSEPLQETPKASNPLAGAGTAMEGGGALGWMASRHPKRRATVLVKKDVARARDECPDASKLVRPDRFVDPPCSLSHLTDLLLAGDSRAEKLLQGAPPRAYLAHRLWIQLRNEHRGRHAFLGAALDLEPERTTSLDPKWQTRRWALEELLGDPDPRHWDPADVALVVMKARQADVKLGQELAALERGESVPGVRPGGFADHGPRTPTEGRLLEYLGYLAPMGRKRAVALIGIESVSWPRLNAPAIVDKKLGREMPTPPEAHFLGEYDLYRHDWSSARAAKGLAPCDELSGAERRLCGNEMWLDATARWLKTDESAPHPDLNSVRKALRELQRQRKKDL